MWRLCTVVAILFISNAWAQTDPEVRRVGRFPGFGPSLSFTHRSSSCMLMVEAEYRITDGTQKSAINFDNVQPGDPLTGLVYTGRSVDCYNGDFFFVATTAGAAFTERIYRVGASCSNNSVTLAIPEVAGVTNYSPEQLAITEQGLLFFYTQSPVATGDRGLYKWNVVAGGAPVLIEATITSADHLLRGQNAVFYQIGSTIKRVDGTGITTLPAPTGFATNQPINNGVVIGDASLFLPVRTTGGENELAFWNGSAWTLKDVCAGACSGDPAGLTRSNGHVFFRANLAYANGALVALPLAATTAEPMLIYIDASDANMFAATDRLFFRADQCSNNCYAMIDSSLAQHNLTNYAPSYYRRAAATMGNRLYFATGGFSAGGFNQASVIVWTDGISTPQLVPGVAFSGSPVQYIQWFDTPPTLPTTKDRIFFAVTSIQSSSVFDLWVMDFSQTVICADCGGSASSDAAHAYDVAQVVLTTLVALASLGALAAQ